MKHAGLTSMQHSSRLYDLLCTNLFIGTLYFIFVLLTHLASKGGRAIKEGCAKPAFTSTKRNLHWGERYTNHKMAGQGNEMC
jgi:hypothetical protein